MDKELVSAVHHQRHAPCAVLIEASKDEGIPFRVSVMACDSRWLPRRTIFPFDAFVDLGLEPNVVGAYNVSMFTHALEYSTFLDVFDTWVERCALGENAVGEPRKFLPLFLNVQQEDWARELWPDGILDDWAVHPYRNLESIIAHTNDRADTQGDLPLFGKNTYMQFCAKMGYEIPRSDRGPLRLDFVCRAYAKLLHT